MLLPQQKLSPCVKEAMTAGTQNAIVKLCYEAKIWLKCCRGAPKMRAPPSCVVCGSVDHADIRKRHAWALKICILRSAFKTWRASNDVSALVHPFSSRWKEQRQGKTVSGREGIELHGGGCGRWFKHSVTNPIVLDLSGFFELWRRLTQRIWRGR